MFSFSRIIYSFFNLSNFYPVTRFLITPLLVTCYCFQLLCLVTPVFVLKQQDLDPVIILHTLMCEQQKRVDSGNFFFLLKEVLLTSSFVRSSNLFLALFLICSVTFNGNRQLENCDTFFKGPLPPKYYDQIWEFVFDYIFRKCI